VATQSGSQDETAIGAAPIDMDRTRTALALVAPFFRAGEMKHLTQAIQESHPRVNPDMPILTIHLE
jgi:hypothetical protein